MDASDRRNLPDDPDLPVEPELPARITAVTRQKRRKERFSLFADRQFLIGVSEDTLLEFNLSPGTEITHALFRRLQRAEGRGAVKSYFLDLLARRDHARRELADKARKKDLNRDFVEEVIDELERKGLVDDRAFAVKYADDKAKGSRWGPAKIMAHLRRKGIGRDDIDHSLRAAFEGVEVREILFDLVLKRKRHFLREEHPLKRKKKIFDYLSRRGFRSASINPCLQELTDMLNR